jgi:hypothetical protein
MKASITEQCILMLKREDFKDQFRQIVIPVISFLLNELKNYICFIVVFSIITFLMILSILVILIQIMRNAPIILQEVP